MTNVYESIAQLSIFDASKEMKLVSNSDLIEGRKNNHFMLISDMFFENFRNKRCVFQFSP